MQFAVVDLSIHMSSTELVAYAQAQQLQLTRDYASYFNGDGIADTVRVAHNANGAWDLRPAEVPILLHPSVPKGSPDDALGIHDLSKQGVPIIHVYMDLLKQEGQTWTSCASHEVLESRADPRLHLCVELDNGEIWDREICDRVEADEYEINGVKTSNFNTPACFEPAGTTNTIFDFMKLSKHPNEVRPGGYAQKYDKHHGWTQVGGMRPYRAKLAELGLSRGARRKARHHYAE